MNENDDSCNKKSDGFDCNDSAQYDPGPKSLAWVIYWISCYIPAIYPRLRWYTLPLIMKIYHLALLRKPTNKEGYSKMNLWKIQSCREKVFYQLDQIGQLFFVISFSWVGIFSFVLPFYRMTKKESKAWVNIDKTFSPGILPSKCSSPPWESWIFEIRNCYRAASGDTLIQFNKYEQVAFKWGLRPYCGLVSAAEVKCNQLPDNTLHRLTNWNQRNNGTIEPIRNDDDGGAGEVAV